jgi:aspartate aminotransferase-like enzyme
MVPGPVEIPRAVREAYLDDVGSSDVEVPSFYGEYAQVQSQLRQLVGAERATPVLMMGEGMLALWSALKSSVRAGDRVVAVSNGLYGFGIGEMARSVGCEVDIVEFAWDQVLGDVELAEIRRRIELFRPSLVTAVLCETPSGMLNRRLRDVGAAARDVGALFYVDFVSAAGGVAVDFDECHIDLGLLGSQKVLSAPPSISVVFVSERAWQRIASVAYVGYDALLPWREASQSAVVAPYTFDWNALRALRASLRILFDEGLERVFARHAAVAAECRRQLRALGLQMHVGDDDGASPTVTAFLVPAHLTWAQLDAAVRANGVVLGGSYGKLEGVVARVGHMGSQATLHKVARTAAAIARAIETPTVSPS